MQLTNTEHVLDTITVYNCLCANLLNYKSRLLHPRSKIILKAFFILLYLNILISKPK